MIIKTLTIFAASFVFTVAQKTKDLPVKLQKHEKTHNILSIDGGNAQGVMLPLFLIDYIENETYRYAEEKNYLTSPKANQKLPMSKFFDSVVGTSIGGLAAAGFSVPDKDQKNEPAYYSNDLRQIILKAQPIYQKEVEQSSTKVFNTLQLGFITGVLLYLMTSSASKDSAGIDKIFDQMEEWIKKREINRLTGVEPAGKPLSQEVVEDFQKIKNSTWEYNFEFPAGMKRYAEKYQESEKMADLLCSSVRDQRNSYLTYRTSWNLFWALWYGFVCFLLVGFGYLISFWVFTNPYQRNDIDVIAKNVFGNMKFEDALTEVNLPVYDVKQRRLNFYSKASFDESPVNKISFADAIAATITSIKYSKEKVIQLPNQENGQKLEQQLIEGSAHSNDWSVLPILKHQQSGSSLPVRVLSLGSGTPFIFDSLKEFYETKKTIFTQDFTQIHWTQESAIQSFVSKERYQQFQASSMADDYLRLDTFPHQISSETPNKLVEAIAYDILQEQKAHIDELCHLLVEERKDQL